jgi:hypothetical protein
MKVFLAYSENYHDLLIQEKSKIIISYGRLHGSRLNPSLPSGFNNMLLDSGGFQTAFGTQERTVNITGYTLWTKFIIDRYGKFGNGGIISGFMGLDSMEWIESLQNYEFMRKQGLECIPVWKAFWPEYVLDYLCGQFEYVAIGGIAFGGSKETLRHIFERVLIKYPMTKFHGLGVGIRGGVAFKSFRPYSVDVSTWSVPARYGHDIVFDKKQVLKEKVLPQEMRDQIRNSKELERQLVHKAIKLINSLDTELEKLNEPYQTQMV